MRREYNDLPPLIALDRIAVTCCLKRMCSYAYSKNIYFILQNKEKNL